MSILTLSTLQCNPSKAIAYPGLPPSEGSDDTVLQDQDNAELISALVRSGPPGGSRELSETDQQSDSRD